MSKRQGRLRQLYDLIRSGGRLREHAAAVWLRELNLHDAAARVFNLGDSDTVTGSRCLTGKDRYHDLCTEIYCGHRWWLLKEGPELRELVLASDEIVDAGSDGRLRARGKGRK